MTSSLHLSGIIKNIVIILLLLFVPGIGLMTMYLLTKWSKWVKIVITLIYILPATFIITYLFIGKPIKIVGVAMEPNYKNGQLFFANKLAYRFSEPKRGDVIIFNYPKDPNQEFDKRIIGLPGEKIKIKDGKIYINNKILSESYLTRDAFTFEGGFLKEGVEVVIPMNNYFVLGDNPDKSSDSRIWGFVPKENITGKIEFSF